MEKPDRVFADHALGITTARAFIRLAGLLRSNGTLGNDEYEALRAAFTADLDVWQARLANAEQPATAKQIEDFRVLLDAQWSRSGPQ